MSAEQAREENAYTLGVQAYLRGFPLYFYRVANADDEFVASLHQIGLSAGNVSDWRTLDEPVKRGLSRAARAGEQIVDGRWQATGDVKNGWRYTSGGGRAGYDFALRAALAKNQLGAQLAQEILYPNAQEVLTSQVRAPNGVTRQDPSPKH